jgi:hypothetical protein
MFRGMGRSGGIETMSISRARVSRLFAFALIPLALTGAPAPAGSESRGCGLPMIADPGIRASFAQFDSTQSAAAAKLCSLYLNTSGGFSSR